MVHHRFDLGGLRAIDLVEHAQHALARAVRQLQRRPLGRLRRLPDAEHPDDRVRLLQEVARDALVFGEDRVQPGRVDDLDAAERLHGKKYLHDPDRARFVGAQPGQEARDVGGGQRARATVVGDDARGGLGAVAEHVHRRGRRRDAGRCHVGAAQRVDERRLAGVELAHHRDQQRPIERLGRVSGGGGQADERRRGREQVVRPGEQAGELARRRRWRRAAHQEVARRRSGREAAEPQDLRVARVPGGERGEGLAQAARPGRRAPSP